MAKVGTEIAKVGERAISAIGKEKPLVGEAVKKSAIKEFLNKINAKGWGMAIMFLGLPILDIIARLKKQRQEWDKQLSMAKKGCKTYADFDQRQACLHKALAAWCGNMMRIYRQELALVKSAYNKCPASKQKQKKILWKQMQHKEKKLAYYKRLNNALHNPNTSISDAYDQAKNP